MMRSVFAAKPDRARLAGGTLLGATLVGAGWAWDARRHKARASRVHRAAIELLLNTLQADDALTSRHSRRVANLSDALAAPLRLSREERATLRVAALLHDMGKIDDRFFHIVHSRDPLTPEQRAEIENHPHYSATILRPLEQIHPGLMGIVSSHHECWNGSGYPRGLEGDEIPLGGRIISLADVFDALTQRRAYREPLEVREALREIERGAGSKFDPELVEAVGKRRVWKRWARIAREGRKEEEEAREEEQAE